MELRSDAVEVGEVALNDGFEYKAWVGEAAASMTVLDYLADRYRHSGVSVWRDRLNSGQVFLDGLPASERDVLRTGQKLVWRRPPWEEPDVPLCYAVLYRDEDVLAVAKPSGLPTIPAGGFFRHTLLARVRQSHPEAAPAHRLGRGTSGVVVFARSASARSGLAAQFRQGMAVKVYLALVAGRPEAHDFEVNASIGPVSHPRLGTVHAACTTGKRAVSRIRVLERRADCSLVRVRIETGRPHQIRIHLAAAGHPLVGDPLYDSGGRLKEDGSALPGDIGYWLHAASLRIEHPVTLESIEIVCPPPPLLRRLKDSSDARCEGDFPSS